MEPKYQCILSIKKCASFVQFFSKMILFIFLRFFLQGLQKTSNNPAFLYGYGGYGDTSHTLPSYKPERLFFADNFNGIVAIASIRGGG